MLSPADTTLLRGMMGRTPRGVVAIAARCPAGHPSVVTSYPLWRQGERLTPFPTLYWLCCPQLRAAVSHLEREGTIAVLQAELARDPALQAALRADHQAYIAQRWATLSPEDRDLLSARSLGEDFHTRGIGGMTNFASIKCLHLHLAHHLAAGNVLGRLLVERYGVRPCGLSERSREA